MASFIVRFVFTWTMIGAFYVLILYGGAIGLSMFIVLLQVLGFHELLSLCKNKKNETELPFLFSIHWLLFITTLFFLYTMLMQDVLHQLILTINLPIILILISNSYFISFCLLIVWLLSFVLYFTKSDPAYYNYEFTTLSWSITSISLTICPSVFAIPNIFNGLCWYLFPASCIIVNDIMAYMFGKFLGKTKLIKLSPKKTWEGVIGGGVSTILWGVIVSSYITNNLNSFWTEPHSFVKDSCNINVDHIFKIGNIELLGFKLTEFHIHSFWFAIFASTIAPFGGFLASAFKRSFKKKDFGDLIPGHGGIVDRMDCQIIMNLFVYTYMHSFVKPFNQTE